MGELVLTSWVTRCIRYCMVLIADELELIQSVLFCPCGNFEPGLLASSSGASILTSAPRFASPGLGLLEYYQYTSISGTWSNLKIKNWKIGYPTLLLVLLVFLTNSTSTIGSSFYTREVIQRRQVHLSSPTIPCYQWQIVNLQRLDGTLKSSVTFKFFLLVARENSS